MIKKILVCLDGSEIAEQILPLAVEQAKMHGGELILFSTVYESGGMSINIPGAAGVPVNALNLEENLRKDLESVSEYLEGHAEFLRKEAGVNVSTDVYPGMASSSIIGYAEDNDVDLIAMSSHGHGGLERAIIGSTTDYVVRNSGKPTLVIRPKSVEEEIEHKVNKVAVKRILVCLDESYLAEQILPFAVEQARYFKSRLTLLEVLDAPDSDVTVNLKASAPVADKENEYYSKEEKEARDYLGSLEDSYDATGLDTDFLVLHGHHAGETIVEFARNNNVDMITMCTHGRSGFSRTIFGSITDHVLRNAGIPLMVIRPKEKVE